MSNDLVEIALAAFTDSALFERLACEVMRDEGYHDIQRRGTSNDFGIDAIEDVFYEEVGKLTTVFQFTLEDYILGKMRDTIEKLRKHKIIFDRLIIVTTTDLSPERDRNLKKAARKDYAVSVECYHRETLHNRLSDYSNGIFHRFFPSIDQQIAEMQAARPVFDDTDNAREAAILRTAIAFGVSPESQRARKSMFDHLVLATLAADTTKGLTAEEIGGAISTSLGIPPFPAVQIAASLGRLKAAVSIKDGKYHLSQDMKVQADAATIKTNGLTESLISDIVDEVCATLGERVSQNDRRRLERNAKQLLREIFRLNCLPLANIAAPGAPPQVVSAQNVAGLIDIASQHTTPERANLLIAALASVISNPTEQQSHILAAWARVYIGAALMNLDPLLRECHATRLKDKIFVLDTDIVLSAIVRETPTSTVLRGLVASLLDLGVRVVIPTQVINECTRHAERSTRTYYYHNGTLLAMSPSVVDIEVRNLFVRAYYFGITNRTIPAGMRYESFLDNYFDNTDPEGFFKEVIGSVLPAGVEVIDLAKLQQEPLDVELLKKTTDKMLEVMLRRNRIDTRTREENEALASNDATLMLTALQLNTHAMEDKGQRILWARCYVVTRSTRYLYAASELGVNNVISTSAQHLLALIENIGGPATSDSDVVQLLENPLLTYVVNEMWSDIEKLLANGIALAGKSLVRLKRDLDTTLHDCLVAVELQDENQVRGDEDGTVSSPGDYVELITSAEGLGYAVHPLARQARDAFTAQDEKDARIEDLEKHVTELEGVVKNFGKRKERYLRRMAARKKGR